MGDIGPHIHFSVAGNIDASLAANATFIILTGTMTGDITLTLPAFDPGAGVVYKVDSTQITLSGGTQPHNIVVQSPVGGTLTRTMAAGSDPGLWIFYIDPSNNVLSTNPLV